MKTTLCLLAWVLPVAAQQPFDFKLLDKLGAKAKTATNITLEGDSLKLAQNLLGNDGDKDAAALKSLVASLKGVYVRSWEFAKEGMYTPADLEPFRAYVRAPGWSKIVDVKEEKETSEVFIRPGADNKLAGVAVIAAEPLEVTVVYIDGSISMEDIGKLSGTLNIPDLDPLKHGTATGGKSNQKKKE
jgi:hypothetical protein